MIVQRGPAFGYYVNPSKTYLVVKQNRYEEAVNVFEDTGVHITTNGKRYLGSPIGTSSFKDEYAQIKIDEWKKELQNLVEVAATQPQAAYSALIVSIQSKWAYLARTTENISHLLQPIEYVLRHKLIPAITGKIAINDVERRMFALPVRHGGLGIEILTEVADHKFSNSRKVTQPLRNSICSREGMDEAQIDAEMNRLAREVKK